MNRKITALLLVMLTVNAAFSSCKKDDAKPNNGGGTEQPTKPNTVYGTVTDAQGKPLAGVKVRAVNPTGSNIFVEGFTNSKGQYSFQISSIGGWNIYAWHTAEYKGQNFYVRLANKDEDYNPFTTNGGTVKKDFVWKLTGRIPDRNQNASNGWGFFGACMRFVNDNVTVPVMASGTKVIVTLTPVAGAKYLDGTAATQVIERSFVINTSTNYYLTDIPGSEYRLTVKSEKDGVTKEVYVGPNDNRNLQQWVEFYFDSADAPGSLEGGYLTPAEFPWYMGQKR